MNYKLKQNNIINIGGKEIIYPNETDIKSITEFDNVICFFTFPKSNDLNWSKIETHQIWKNRCDSNPSELFCFHFNGLLKWKFQEKNIVGFGKIDIENLKEGDFISTKHYENYIEKFNGKELLEVYVGNFRFILDAETGEIYDKIESR